MVRRSGWLGRAKRVVAGDLREDPYLRYILLLALVLAGFWFWHRIPVFATWDEHDRILDALVTYGSVVADPSFEGVREGVSWSRAAFGPTFYLYTLAVLPVVAAAALTGQLDVIAAMQDPSRAYAHYQLWAETPRWIWTWSIGLVRLTNVVFAVATVYLVYRLGTRLRDRATGRLAALLLSVTFGFLKLAKEGGEDMPATLCFVAALYLLVGYAETGQRRQFYAASAVGGLALAFKLTLGLVVPVVALAFLLRCRGEDGRLWQPRLLLGGAVLGAVVIGLSYSALLVGDFDAVYVRLFGKTGRTSKALAPTAPTWWWFTRTYASAFGWPLLVAAVLGVAASVERLLDIAPSTRRERAPEFDKRALVVGALALFVLFFAQWHDFRVHHLLPTFPLVAVLLADVLTRLRDRRRTVGRVAIAVVVVSSAVYAGVGVGMYASMPRDEATEWLTDNADEDATMETYYHGFLENAIPHGMDINPIWRGRGEYQVCPEYIQVGYKELLYLQDIPDDQRGADVDYGIDTRAEYTRALLDGEYNYEIVAEFGERPPNFVPDRPDPGSLRDLVPLGIYPHTDQYGDEQELRANQYVAILRLDGACVESRRPPWSPRPSGRQ